MLALENPYVLAVKQPTLAYSYVQSLVDTHISFQEETVFGDFLGGLAIFVCSRSLGGRKSSKEGIDLEFDKDGVRYVVAVKSGPNWGNSQQIRKMLASFTKAKRIFGTGGNRAPIVCVNGCCYGQEPVSEKGDYRKLCGQAFWEFISGDENLYIDIIEPLGHQARERNEAYQIEYARVLNLFTAEFVRDFCDDGYINWAKLVRFNSRRR